MSHETICRTLDIQTRGALEKELLQHLRRTRAMRRSHHHTQKTADHGRICHTIPVSERPPSAGKPRGTARLPGTVEARGFSPAHPRTLSRATLGGNRQAVYPYYPLSGDNTPCSDSFGPDDADSTPNWD